MRDILVVKLGGSLARTGAVTQWLAALAASPGPLVVVPGGGAFADTVRAAQSRLGYDDDAAHDMALMAMAQLARALASLAPRLAYADTLPAIEAALGQGRPALFAAWPALRDAPDLPRGWHVTSDSISLVLARRLRAARLLLVKSADPATGDAAALARAGLLDDAFPTLLRDYPGTAHITGPAPPRALSPLPGLRLHRAPATPQDTALSVRVPNRCG